MATYTTPSGKRHRVRKEVWQPKFIAKYSQTMNFSEAADYAGISRWGAQKSRDSDEKFRTALETARTEAIEALEREAWHRATNLGSDRVLIHLLKAYRPEVHNRPQQHEVSGPNGGPIGIDIAGRIRDRIAAIKARQSDARPPVVTDGQAIGAADSGNDAD